MDSACPHVWFGDPAWSYRMCALCYDVTDRVLVPELREDPADPAGPPRRGDWTEIATNSPIFMSFMQHNPPCPRARCLGRVIEETTRRRDGTIATGFICQQCGSRWWAEES